MGLQIPYGVCHEILKESILQRETFRDKRNIKNIMLMERIRNNRRRSAPKLHTYAFECTHKYEYIWIYGVFEGEE